MSGLRDEPERPERIALTVEVHATSIAGYGLFRGDVNDLFDEFCRLLLERRPHLVVTPNVDQVLRLPGSAPARDAYRRASLRLVDGSPLLALARWAGDHTITRLPGSDLMIASAAESTNRAWRIAIAGGGDDVSREAARRLSEANPGASIASVRFPHLTHVDDPRGHAVAAELEAIRPDIVFLCLGFPKQESWFLHMRHLLPPAIYIGAGAAVDFAAGVRSRAPKYMQQAGLEWLWRLAQEPRRLAHRYLVRGPRFLSIVAASVAARMSRPTVRITPRDAVE